MANMLIMTRAQADAADASQAIFRDIENGEEVSTQGGTLVFFVEAQLEPAGARQIVISEPTPISVVNELTVSRLYATQNLADSTGFTDQTATSNFASIAGTIVSAVVSPLGDAPSTSAPLSLGDIVGFRVTVTDSAGNVATFDSNFREVEFKASTSVTSINELRITINDLVPNEESLTVSVGSGPYAGTYTPTAGNLRGDPYNFGGSGLPVISGTAEVGQTLTLDLRGLWGTNSGTLTYSQRWTSDGVDISGATAETFVVTGAQAGTDVRCVVTADDGTNTTDAASNAIAIPASAVGLSYDVVLNRDFDTVSESTKTVSTTDLNTLPGVSEGDFLVFMLTGASQSSNRAITGFASTGVTITQRAINPGTRRATAAIYTCTAPATWTNDLVATWDGSINGGGKLAILKISGNPSIVATDAEGSNPTSTMSMSLNAKADGLVLAIGSINETALGAARVESWTGLPGTPEYESVPGHSTTQFDTAYAAITADATPLNFSYSMDGTGHMACCAISLEPAA